MNRLDKVIDFMRQKRGKRFVMRSNDSCLLFTDSGRQPLNRVMSGQEVETMLTEVLPNELQNEYKNGGSFVFPYQTPQGQLTIGVNRQNGRLEVAIGQPGETVLEVIEPPKRAAPKPKAPPTKPAPAAGTSETTPAPATEPVAPVPAAIPTTAATRVASTAAPVVTVAPPPHVDYPTDYLSGVLRQAREAYASDVHLRAGVMPRLRVGGVMQELAYGQMLTGEQLHTALLDFVPPERQHEWLATGATKFSFNFDSQTRLRCYCFYERTGAAAVLRLLPGQPPTIESVDLPPVIARLGRSERGLVIISGPRVSGRSTTLAALINSINAERRAHIVCVDEPIEYVYRSQLSVVTQWEIPTHAPTYAEALRKLPLANADVCAIADLSKPETLQAAFEAAECGTLVIGVMHLPDMPTLLDLMVDELSTGDKPRMSKRLAQVLQGIVCQFMCQRKDGGGTVPIFEALVTNPAIATLIRDGNLSELRSMMAGGEEGMMTFNDSLLQRVQQGHLTPAEGLKRTPDAVELRRLFSRNGIAT